MTPVSQPIAPAEDGLSNTTALEAFPLVFENQVRLSFFPRWLKLTPSQYLQIASALPENANIYGLGEYVSSSGFRRDPSGTVQTFWGRDAGNPVDQNEYGSHPVYVEHRYAKDNKTGSTKGRSHAVFLRNSHGMDVVLRNKAVEYRAIGGTLDFYFFAGPDPKQAIEQYGASRPFCIGGEKLITLQSLRSGCPRCSPTGALVSTSADGQSLLLDSRATH